jgi:hypothetical protein
VKPWTDFFVAMMLPLMLPGAIHAQTGTDPVFGTWKLNIAKSTFEPGPAPKNQTRVYEATADGSTKVTIQTTTASGETQMRGSTYKEDGTPHAVTGSQNYDMAATTRVNALRAKDTLTRSGKVVGQLTRVESKDLKVMTITLAFTTPSGQSEHDVLVYERQ